MSATLRKAAAWCAAVVPAAVLMTGTAAAADLSGAPARGHAPRAATAPWSAPTSTLVIDRALGARARTVARVFGYIDRHAGLATKVRVRPVARYLTGGAAVDHVQTVRIGDPGAGHLAFTMRYVTPAGAVHSDTIVRPGLPATGPGSFTRVLAHEAEMSVGVGECADPGAVCFWTFGTALPVLDATDLIRLAAVRLHIARR